MDTITAIETRRSVKQFDPDHRMSAADCQQLMRLALLSPTAFNLQHWRFVLVQDPGLRQRIREVAWNQSQVTDASLLVVVCADLKAWEKNPGRYWENAPQEVREGLLPAIAAYYRDRPQAQRDEALRSCGIVAQTLMLAATAMGYQSCPMDGFDFDAVAALIGLPDDHLIGLFVAIGKGTQEPWPRPGQLPLEEVIFTDHF